MEVHVIGGVELWVKDADRDGVRHTSLSMTFLGGRLLPLLCFPLLLQRNDHPSRRRF